jgi:hypothetical protein
MPLILLVDFIQMPNRVRAVRVKASSIRHVQTGNNQMQEPDMQANHVDRSSRCHFYYLPSGSRRDAGHSRLPRYIHNALLHNGKISARSLFTEIAHYKTRQVENGKEYRSYFSSSSGAPNSHDSFHHHSIHLINLTYVRFTPLYAA